VARIEYGPKNTDVRVAFQRPARNVLGVFTTPDANALNTSAAVRAELPNIQRDLPPGMTIQLVYDASDNIRGSIREVFKTIAEAVIIVVLVILVFLGSFRSVLVPIFTISAVADRVCFILYAMGYHQSSDAARHGARHASSSTMRSSCGEHHRHLERASGR